MLLAVTLCFSTVPITAFAQETEAVAEREEQTEEADAVPEPEQEATDPATVQEEAVAALETPTDKNTTAEDSGAVENVDADGENGIVALTNESVSDSDAGTQDTGTNGEADTTVQAVQALIDALPDQVTEENAESIGEQLAAIDEAMLTLTEEQIAALDMERYEKICVALKAPALVATQAGEEHTHFLCGGEDCNEVGHTESSKVTFEAWNKTDSLPTDAGYYYLTNDVILNETCYISSTSASTVVLCLNGHSITGVKENKGDIQIWDKVTFILCNCQNQGIITHEDGISGYGVYVMGTFNMYGGSISGNNQNNGAGVTIGNYENATFNMYGGDISNNKATQEKYGSGGGVTVIIGTFNMYGGTISGNSAVANGGGVEMSPASSASEVAFNMYGGTISGNSADNYGGGVYIGTGGYRVGGTFTMTGGRIADNTAGINGGGVYDQGTFQMSGTPAIANNKANDKVNNVYLPQNADPIQLTDSLEDDACVGITSKTLPTSAEDSTVKIATGNADAIQSALGKFSVDGGSSTGYGIASIAESDGNYLVLQKLEPHQHNICGDSNCSEHIDTVDWTAVSTEAELKAVEAGTETDPKYYYLLNDITLTEAWIPAGNVVLCLNGKSMKANGNFTAIICKNTTFTLTDCQQTVDTITGTITHTSGEGRGVAVEGSGYGNGGGSFTMYGGSITGNNVMGNGGGVYLDNSKDNHFTMHGGSITNNTAGGNGGGVYAANGYITMTDGTIESNTATSEGGGVHIGDQNQSTASFTMSGGRLKVIQQALQAVFMWAVRAISMCLVG